MALLFGIAWGCCNEMRSLLCTIDRMVSSTLVNALTLFVKASLELSMVEVWWGG